MPTRSDVESGDVDRSDEHHGVVIGWIHHDLGSSIGLRIQTASSQQALQEKHIENHHFLMTRNQALLLAKFLLDVTGQKLPARTPPSLWQRFRGKSNK